MLAFLKRIAASFRMGLDYRDEWTAYFRAKEDSRAKWLREQAAISKNQRLAQIAREREELIKKIKKAVEQKKARGAYFIALRRLKAEELSLETSR